MTIQVNTDHNIEGSERLIEHVKEVVNHSLDRYSSHITRVEVHFTDENGNKTGVDDKRCVLEARMEHIQPVAVVTHAGTTEQALKAAVEKLKGSLDSIIGKMRQIDHNVKDELIDLQ